MGLEGEVEDQDFRNLFYGFSRDGETALVKNAGHLDGYHKRCPGWDLTFNVPKSVSVLWSQSPREVQRKIEGLNAEAVRTALDIMEELAGVTRRGHGGKIREKAAFVYALFPHCMSRAQEPHIHTHTILFNLARRADGTTGAVRSNDVFNYKMAVGALQRCALAKLLEQELHLTVEKVSTSFEIKEVSPDLIDTFSTRRKQLKAYCDAHGAYNGSSFLSP